MKNLHAHTIAAEELYDLSMLEEMDDTEYLLEMLSVLIREAPKDIKGMTEAFDKNDLSVVCQKAHKLKSSAGIIQAQKLTGLLDDIEAIGKKGVASAELLSLVETAISEYNLIEASLKNYITDLVS
jgi:HPt (histidine-containing phosphotransfer) domain-containing protein